MKPLKVKVPNTFDTDPLISSNRISSQRLIKESSNISKALWTYLLQDTKLR